MKYEFVDKKLQQAKVGVYKTLLKENEPFTLDAENAKAYLNEGIVQEVKESAPKQAKKQEKKPEPKVPEREFIVPAPVAEVPAPIVDELEKGVK